MAVWNQAKHPTYKSDRDERIELIENILKETTSNTKSWFDYIEQQNSYQTNPVYGGKIGQRYVRHPFF